MKKKEYEKHKSRVDKLIRKWALLTGVGLWECAKVDYYSAEKDFNHSLKTYKVPAGWGRLMSMTTLWQYEDARLKVNVPAVVGMTDSDLEETVAHEFCHALVNELRPSETPDQEYMRHEEHVCTVLAAALIRANKENKHGD